MYLEPAPGEIGPSNILKMAREGLRRDLTTALHKAVATGETVCCPGVRVKTNGDFTTVNLIIRPVAVAPATSPEPPLYLVILEEAPGQGTRPTKNMEAVGRVPSPGEKTPHGEKSAARIAALEQELQVKEEYLQTSNEELKSSNEEMQSVNEELQSTNEELATVNAELQTKVADLSQANNDMKNLLAGTGIATVFVDHQLRILRFTPAATKIINLIHGDIGRPVSHIVSNLPGYGSLKEDTQAVLDTLVPKEADVQTAEGRWYTMRITPYRTMDNVIEGAVLTFVDVTEVVQTRDLLHKANDQLRMAVVVRDAHDAITLQDLDGRIIAWNPGAVRMYGWSETEALTMNVCDLIPESLRKDALTRLIELSQAKILEPYNTQRITKTGEIVDVSIISTALLDVTGKLYAISTTERVEKRGEK